MSSGDIERRSAPRYVIPLPLRLRIAERPEEERARVLDISEGGLSFDRSRWLAEGTLLSLRFPVYSERYSLVGVITRCDEIEASGAFRVGLYFLRPSRGFRIHLGEEIAAIRELRKELHLARRKDVSLEEAAHEWIESCRGRVPELYDT